MRTFAIVVASRDEELRDRLGSAAWLAHLDVDVAWTRNAAQALARARQGTTRLLLADDTLGADSATRLARQARKARPDLTVVCVSSRPDAGSEIALRQIGVLYVMVRPIDYPLLSRVLRRALESDTRKYLRTPASPPMGVRALPQNA